MRKMKRTFFYKFAKFQRNPAETRPKGAKDGGRNFERSNVQ